MANVSKDLDGLKDLVLREQFMQSFNKNLQVFLKERKVKSVVEMAELVEQYNEAHGIQILMVPKYNHLLQTPEIINQKEKKVSLSMLKAKRTGIAFTASLLII